MPFYVDYHTFTYLSHTHTHTHTYMHRDIHIYIVTHNTETHILRHTYSDTHTQIQTYTQTYTLTHIEHAHRLTHTYILMCRWFATMRTDGHPEIGTFLEYSLNTARNMLIMGSYNVSLATKMIGTWWLVNQRRMINHLYILSAATFLFLWVWHLFLWPRPGSWC